MSEPKGYWLNKYTCEVHIGKLSDDDIRLIESSEAEAIRTERDELKAKLETMTARAEKYAKALIILDKEAKSQTQAAAHVLDVLDLIQQMDISDSPPDFQWLQKWRHKTKQLASSALSNYLTAVAKAQAETSKTKESK